MDYIILIQPGEKGGLKIQPVFNNKEINVGLIQGGFTGLHFAESMIQNELIKLLDKPVTNPEEPEKEEKV
jgi:hypothetical protein